MSFWRRRVSRHWRRRRERRDGPSATLMVNVLAGGDVIQEAAAFGYG